MLTDETIRRHLEGQIIVGLFAINPSTQRCKWDAIDADYGDAMEDLLKLQYYLSEDGVQSALEMRANDEAIFGSFWPCPAGQGMPNLHP